MGAFLLGLFLGYLAGVATAALLVIAGDWLKYRGRHYPRAEDE